MAERLDESQEMIAIKDRFGDTMIVAPCGGGVVVEFEFTKTTLAPGEEIAMVLSEKGVRELVEAMEKCLKMAGR